MLPENRIVYGIHSITPYRLVDRLYYGTLKVLGASSLNISSEFEDLYGGSQSYPWAVEPKNISAEFTATVKSLPDFLFELYLGASVTTTAASTTGTFSALANQLGTSAFDASTGIASAAMKTGEEANLKDGCYVVEVVSSTTFDVYLSSDLEAKRGTNLEIQDASMKITASPLTLVTGAAVEIPNTGIELTGGSGTIDLGDVGNTCYFYVSSPHGGLSEISIGSDASIFAEHGQFCLSKKRSNGDTFELELFKVVASGFPIPMEEMAFSIPELTTKLVYDSSTDVVGKIRAKAHA